MRRTAWRSHSLRSPGAGQSVQLPPPFVVTVPVTTTGEPFWSLATTAMGVPVVTLDGIVKLQVAVGAWTAHPGVMAQSLCAWHCWTTGAISICPFTNSA